MKKPVIRIVRMTFHPERVSEFLLLFDERSAKIRSFEGCEGLDLVQDTRFDNVLTTISVWASEDALSAYRDSDLFGDTWRITKGLFADRPEAATHTLLTTVETASS